MAKSAAVKESKIKDRVKANIKKEKEEKTKTPKASKAKLETNEVGIRKGTVMETIFDCLKKGSTSKEILEACVKAHPDREKDAMEKTIRLQIFRMPKEKGFTLVKEDSDAGKRYKIGKIDSSLKEKSVKKEKTEKTEKPEKKKGKKGKKAKEEKPEEEDDDEGDDGDDD